MQWNLGLENLKMWDDLGKFSRAGEGNIKVDLV
jgi:hypothetical protein